MPFLTSPPRNFIVLFIFLLGFGIGTLGASKIELYFDLTWVLPDGHYSKIVYKT